MATRHAFLENAVNQDLALSTLSSIMKWSDGQAREEFAWLRLMARVKYDEYSDFLAGARFIESLARWLQQFERGERAVAYDFVRNQLVFISATEMRRLVESFYPQFVQRYLVTRVARRLAIPTYRVWSTADGVAAFERLRRNVLFMGLSDGAHVDILRHANAGVLSNEQVVPSTQVDPDKWRDLLKRLRKETGDKDARFAAVYLIDDFMATGTSFLRFNADSHAWSGKLLRFSDSVKIALSALADDPPFEPDWELCIHHHVATSKAATDVAARLRDIRGFLQAEISTSSLFSTHGVVLPADLPIDAIPDRNVDLIALTQKYYDPVLRTENTDVGGTTHMGLGYGGCALPLVLSHNTPNNSIALLWAETPGGQDERGQPVPAMRSLFRRRQRHG
ncbi:MAG: hypothetical protein R2752_20095 [Vicinamibacterales bacterium]